MCLTRSQFHTEGWWLDDMRSDTASLANILSDFTISLYKFSVNVPLVVAYEYFIITFDKWSGTGILWETPPTSRW